MKKSFIFSTSLLVNFFKKIPCRVSELDLNLIRLRKSISRNCSAISAISHLNSICIQQLKHTNEDLFWSSKWVLFKQSIISKIDRVRIELWSKSHRNVANIWENWIFRKRSARRCNLESFKTIAITNRF